MRSSWFSPRRALISARSAWSRRVSDSRLARWAEGSVVGGPAAAALDLLGEVLPGLGHGLVRQRDQVKVINGDCRAGKPHPQRFPERRGGVDRDDLHRQPPFQRSGEQPVTDALVIAAVNDAQDLAGV